MSGFYVQLTSLGLVILAALVNRLAIGDPRWLLAGVMSSFAIWMLVSIVVTVTHGLAIYRGTEVGVMQGFSLLVALVSILLLSFLVVKSQQFPPIHDITTDLVSPPAFSASVQARHQGHNPTDYAATNVAFQQDAYGIIEPLFLPVSVEQAMVGIEKLALSLGWQIQAVDRDQGVLEASDKTALFGFVDDIVVRVQVSEQGTRVDVRSASRIGRSDWGANAQRITRLLDQLQQKFE